MSERCILWGLNRVARGDDLQYITVMSSIGIVAYFSVLAKVDQDCRVLLPGVITTEGATHRLDPDSAALPSEEMSWVALTHPRDYGHRDGWLVAW